MTHANRSEQSDLSDATLEPPAQHTTYATIYGPTEINGNLLAAIRDEHLTWCDAQDLPAKLRGARWSILAMINRLAIAKRAVRLGELVCLAKPARLKDRTGYELATVKGALTALTKAGLIERVSIRFKEKRKRWCYRITWRAGSAGLTHKTESVARDSNSLTHKTVPVARDPESITHKTVSDGSLTHKTETDARDSNSLTHKTTRTDPPRNAAYAAYAACAALPEDQNASNDSATDTPDDNDGTSDNPEQEASIRFLIAAVKWPDKSIRRCVVRHPEFTEDRWRRLWAEVKSRKNIRNPGGLIWMLAEAGEDPQRPPWRLPSEGADRRVIEAHQAIARADEREAEQQRAEIAERHLLETCGAIPAAHVQALVKAALDMMPEYARGPLSTKRWQDSRYIQANMAELLKNGWSPEKPNPNPEVSDAR